MTTDSLSVDNRATLLRGSYLFHGLDAEVLGRVAQLAMPRDLAAGTPLFWQGDEGDALYGVTAGLVRIWLTGPDGKELTLNLMEPGDFFGEIALLDGLPRSANASALSDSRLIAIKRRDFLGLLEREPRLAQHLIELLCERLRITTDRISDAVFLDLASRLAKTLDALATAHGRTTDKGTLIDAKLSQSALAQLLGVTREAVNKQLKIFAKAGLVTTMGGKMVVLNAAGLRERGQMKV
jgi:CRP-like cAMP-binding protein